MGTWGAARSPLFRKKAYPDRASSVGCYRFEQCGVKGNHVIGKELPPKETASSICPECRTEMIITRITPILFGGAFEELSLVCKTCDYKRSIRIERG
jgi:hypothetical protein